MCVCIYMCVYIYIYIYSYCPLLFRLQLTKHLNSLFHLFIFKCSFPDVDGYSYSQWQNSESSWIPLMVIVFTSLTS